MPQFNIENVSTVMYYIALFSTILFTLKTIIFMLTGGDAEVNADFTSEFEAETSFNFLSLQTILAFFMGFGWLGLACLKQWSLSLLVSCLISVAFGLVLMFGTAYLMFLVKKLNHRVKMDYTTCVGKIGKAYTTFEPQAEGQIEIEVNGRLSIEKAINSSDAKIEAFEQVKITKYENKMFYIEK